MKKGILFISLLACLFFTSCKGKLSQTYEDENRVEWSDFSMQELKGTVLEFDDLIMQPLQLMVVDTFLITMNRKTEKFCHIFNLQTNKKVSEQITMGQGPHEMIMPTFIINENSVRLYDMATSKISHYSLDEFIYKSSPVPSRQYKLSEANFFSELAVLGENLVGVSYRPDFPCYWFDANGEKMENGIGVYPKGPQEYSDLEKVDAYRAILTSNMKDRVAICHFFTDLIEIFDTQNRLVKRIYGPEHYYTQFEEYNDGNRVGSKADPNYYRDAFYSPVHVGDEFFVLFNGKFVNKPDYNLLAKDILVFGWDGTPKRHYKLDQGVSRIAVDSKNHKIYGISDDPEYHIVEYSY